MLLILNVLQIHRSLLPKTNLVVVVAVLNLFKNCSRALVKKLKISLKKTPSVLMDSLMNKPQTSCSLAISWLFLFLFGFFTHFKEQFW